MTFSNHLLKHISNIQNVPANMVGNAIPLPAKDIKGIDNILPLIVDNLEQSYTFIKKYFPQKKVISVLSLASGGVPAEYFLLQKNGYVMNYVGIDKNAETNSKARQLLAKFISSGQFHLFDGDASNPAFVVKTCREAGCLPKGGFDLIVIRNGDYTSPVRGSDFRKMVTDVAPACASENAKFFITVQEQEELLAIIPYLMPDRGYSKPGSSNMVAFAQQYSARVDGVKQTPDQFCVVYNLEGFAFKGLLEEDQKSVNLSIANKTSLLADNKSTASYSLSTAALFSTGTGKASLRVIQHLRQALDMSELREQRQQVLDIATKLNSR